MVLFRALGLPLPISATCGLENRRAARVRSTRVHGGSYSKRPEENEEESVTLAALMAEGYCVLDFYLERNSYDNGYCRNNEVFSVQ